VQKVVDGRAANIGLQLAEPDPVEAETPLARLRRYARRAIEMVRRS
jgi:hypothetical protein